jgi:hypothetical protein
MQCSIAHELEGTEVKINVIWWRPEIALFGLSGLVISDNKVGNVETGVLRAES